MGVAIDAAGVLMEEQALRPILKVLMTSPVRSRVVAKCVPVEGTVSVSGIQRADGEEDGVAARLMKMNVGELTPPPPGFVFPGTVLDRNRAVNERCYFPGTFARHKFCYWETESPEYSTPEPRRSHANTIQGLEGSNSALLATLHFRERIMSCDSKSQS